MENGIYYIPTKVIFGKGAEDKIGEEAARYAQQVLLHYGGSSAEKSGLLGRVRKSLEDAGVACLELGGVEPNPRLSLVYEGIQLCKKSAVGAVIAVGGGSVIDSAKAIACGAPNSDDVWDYFLQKKHADGVLPVLDILTIPGAGSESSAGMVITNTETGEKLAYNHDGAFPAVSILNPELTYTVPPYHTATGVSDAIAHVLERYFTNTRYVDVTDRLCESIIRSLVKYGPRALEKPDDYDIRAEIMWACKVAHDGTVGMGREGDWGSHDMEHEISAVYDVAHAAGLTALIPAWMRYVYRHDVNRFIQFAMRVFDVEYNFDDPDYTALEGIRRLESFFKSIGMPTTLRELGVPDRSRLDEIAENGARHAALGGPPTLGHFVKLDQKAIREIMEMAYE